MSYQEKKAFFDKVITIYGRKPVLEALETKDLNIHKLHLADSNKPAKILTECMSLAKHRGIPVEYHDKRKLSFISKNAKQDQGIALDIVSENFLTLDEINLDDFNSMILLDNVTNPQNLGMIIRSCAAGYLDALIIPEKGCADLGPLVIKASVGTIFKCPIIRCAKTIDVIKQAKSHNIVTLELNAAQSLHDYDFNKKSIFVLGNETEGVSKDVQKLAGAQVKIPMNNNVESLNVAVTAALIALNPKLL